MRYLIVLVLFASGCSSGTTLTAAEDSRSVRQDDFTPEEIEAQMELSPVIEKSLVEVVDAYVDAYREHYRAIGMDKELWPSRRAALRDLGTRGLVALLHRSTDRSIITDRSISIKQFFCYYEAFIYDAGRAEVPSDPYNFDANNLFGTEAWEAINVCLQSDYLSVQKQCVTILRMELGPLQLRQGLAESPREAELRRVMLKGLRGLLPSLEKLAVESRDPGVRDAAMYCVMIGGGPTISREAEQLLNSKIEEALSLQGDAAQDPR